MLLMWVTTITGSLRILVVKKYIVNNYNSNSSYALKLHVQIASITGTQKNLNKNTKENPLMQPQGRGFAPNLDLCGCK